MGNSVRMDGMQAEEGLNDAPSFHFDQLAGKDGGSPPRIQSILRIPVTMQVVVGSTTLAIESLIRLGPGAIVPLDRRIGEPVEIIVNGRVIARGEIVVLEEDHTRFGVSLTEMLDPVQLDVETRR
jgi:flagellar motor switch protein FliN